MKSNQPILITGASSGLGEATATLLTSHGAQIFPLDKNLNCDITDEAALSHFFENLSVVPRVCVNCAGIVHAKKLLKMSSEEFKSVLNINIAGTFNVIKHFVEKVKVLDPITPDGERGVIINVSSIAAEEGQIGQVGYSASKGAIASMTLPLARELAEFGIRVVTISPGVMETPMMSQIREDIKDTLVQSVPFPKRLGKSKEFAQLVKHIIENSYLNGCVLRLDAALRMAAK